MNTNFKLPADLAEQVQKLAEVMSWANNCCIGGFACVSSVYGDCEKALKRIVEHSAGKAVAREIDSLRHGWNWGGNRSYVEDVEQAVNDAVDSIQEDLEREVQRAAGYDHDLEVLTCLYAPSLLQEGAGRAEALLELLADAVPVVEDLGPLGVLACCRVTARG